MGFGGALLVGLLLGLNIPSLAHGTNSVIQGTITDTGGVPLSGITVKRVYEGAFSFESESTTTNASGEYSFSNIAENASWIVAGKNGYAEEWYNSTGDEIFNKSTFSTPVPPEEAEELILPDNTTLTDIDIDLGNAASITVTVQDTTAAPLNGFSVKVWYSEDGRFRSGPFVSTNSSGIAVIDDLWPDSYLVRVANGSTNTIDQYFDGIDYFGSESPPPAEATSIPLTFGSTASIVMTIKEGIMAEVALLDNQGQPVASEFVEARSKSGGRLGKSDTTDFNGVARPFKLPPEEVFFVAREGASGNLTEYYSVEDDGTDDAWVTGSFSPPVFNADSIPLQIGVTEILTINLDPKPRINLTLTDANATIFDDLTVKVLTDRGEETERKFITPADNNQLVLDAFPGVNYINVTRQLFGSATPSNIRPGWYDGIETYDNDHVPISAPLSICPIRETPSTSL